MGDRSRLVKVSCPDHHHQLVKGLWNFFQTKHRVDFDVEWGGIPVRVHKLILEVFLSPDTLQRKPLLSNVKRFKRRNVDSLLKFLYTGEAIFRREELDNVSKMAKRLGFDMLTTAIDSVQDKQRCSDVDETKRQHLKRTPKSKSLPSSRGQQCTQRRKLITSEPEEAGDQPESAADLTLVDDGHSGVILDPTGSDLCTSSVVESALEADDDQASSFSEEDVDTSAIYEVKTQARPKRKKSRESRLKLARRSRLYCQKLPLRKCNLCEYQTRERRYYAIHVNKYHPDVQVPTCSICKQVFFDQETLAIHVAKRHSLENVTLTVSVVSHTNGESSILGTFSKTTGATHQPAATESKINPVTSLSSPHLTEGGAGDATISRPSPPQKSELSLAERKRIYRENRPLVKCPICDYNTGEQRYYTTHLRRHHPEVPIPTCDLCQQTFFDEESLHKHKAKPNLLVHTAEYVRPPRITSARLTGDKTAKDKTQLSASERERWNRSNRLPNKFQCDQCEYTTANKLLLTNHRLVNHPDSSVVKCERCQYVFPDEKSLAAHQHKYAAGSCGELGNICRHCSFETPMQYKMYRHMYVRHGVNAKGEPVSRRHKCAECDYTGMLPSHLRRHVLEKHSGLKPYKCPRCTFTTGTRTSVYNHVRKVHLKLKPFLCAMCGKSCSSNHELQRHHRVHTGERPFPCATCGMSFADNYTLTGHIRSKHNDAKPFVCDVCAHAFKRLDNLRIHLKKIHQTQYS